MRTKLKVGAVWTFAMLCLLAIDRAACVAQTAHAASTAVPVLMVSDIHFEPFWDPAKTVQLAKTPSSGWKAILAAPDSADRAQRFSDLQETCHARGIDTSYPLFESSLRAMRADAAGIEFITVSGDLIAHAFSCKYKTVFPQSTPAEYRTFVEKTVEFVIGSLRGNFSNVPVYAALGNNDSDCGDYQLDAQSEFLGAMGKVFAADLPEAERKEAVTTFATGGYYSASLPTPFRHTRLLVLDDLFMARKYSTCADKSDTVASAAQIGWLEQQLERARTNKEHVWVMGHIPPGIDPYGTMTKGRNLCAGGSPQMFLASESLTDTLAGFGDVIQLAVFAHTHMDEMRLLGSEKNDTGRGPVALKMVPSISPIDGNNPSFTLGSADPASGTLIDYRVYVASNQTGIDTTWTEEYDYADAYQEPSFSGASLASLVKEFKGDPMAQLPASQSYLKYYFVGDVSRMIRPFWPQYLCAVSNHTEESYRACACAKTP